MHQLQIVDDYKPQIVQPAAFGAYLGNGDRRIVVNPDVGLAQSGGSHAKLAPLFLTEFAGGQLFAVHKTLVGQQAHDKLLPGHFKIEDGYGFFVFLCHIQTNVQGKGGFTHRRTGGNQQKVGIVQTIDLHIQIVQPRGHSGNGGIGQTQFCQPVKDLVQNGADVFQRIIALAFPQRIDLLFGGLQHLGGRAHLFGYHFLNIRGGLRQTAEHGFLPDDVGIAHHVGGGRGDFHELENIVPGIVVVVAQLLQLVQHGHRIDGLGEVEHGIDCFVDFPVLLKEKVIRGQDAYHIGNTAAVDENGTQDCLLGLQRLGRLSLQQFFIHSHIRSPLFLVLKAEPISPRRSSRSGGR